MNYNWEKYLELAKYLIDNSNKCDEEACLRTSLSRCYYGVRGVLNKYLRKINADSKTNKDFIAFFENSSDIDIKKIGNRIGTLWSKRIVADYKDNFPLTKVQVLLNYVLAKSIIDEFHNIKSSLDFNRTARMLSLKKSN